MAAGQVLDATQESLLAEEVILVDESDNAVGHMSKRESHGLETHRLHRAFSVFLFKNGKLLLQQRAETKVTFPFVWSNTVCSHPLWIDAERVEDRQLGVRRAAVRKTKQELGMTLDENAITFVRRIRYYAPCDGPWAEDEVDYCLFIESDAVPDPNPNEVAAVRYVTQADLRAMVEQHRRGELRLSPWFLMITEKFLFDWWDALLKDQLQSVVDRTAIHKFC